MAQTIGVDESNAGSDGGRKEHRVDVVAEPFVLERDSVTPMVVVTFARHTASFSLLSSYCLVEERDIVQRRTDAWLILSCSFLRRGLRATRLFTLVAHVRSRATLEYFYVRWKHQIWTQNYFRLM